MHFSGFLCILVCEQVSLMESEEDVLVVEVRSATAC
jgi:hypothetical protein